MLQGRPAEAAQLYAKTFNDFGHRPGIAFRAFVGNRLLLSLAAVPDIPLSSSLYVNDAVSRNERLALAYLSGRLPPHAYALGQPPKPHEPEWTEFRWIPYLKLTKAEDKTQWLKSSLNDPLGFPPNSVERQTLLLVAEFLGVKE
jgi:hypothetical protein